MKIGDKITELRKRDRLSQEELAEKLGVARQTISKWEIGETSPDLKQAKGLSRIFKVSLDEMVDNEIKDILIEKVNTTEKKSNQAVKITKIILGCVLGIFVAYLILWIILAVDITKLEDYHSNNSSINSTLLKCSLNSKTYTYLIESDEEDNFISSGGSEYITGIVNEQELKQGKSFKRGSILTVYITTYFNDNDGWCN